jgi:hypothetical protein
MMANAWTDPVFRAVYSKYVKEAGNDHEKSEVAMCSRCHTPIGYMADDQARYTDKLEGVAATGVSCDFCHSVAKSAGIGNGAFMNQPGDAANADPGMKYGPFKDAESPFHGSGAVRSATLVLRDVPANHAHNIMAASRTYLGGEPAHNR